LRLAHFGLFFSNFLSEETDLSEGPSDGL
jgi:hypothetical protein